MLSCTSKRSHRHTILHVSFSNSFGLASARPTPQGLSGAPIFDSVYTKAISLTLSSSQSLMGIIFDDAEGNFLWISRNQPYKGSDQYARSKFIGYEFKEIKFFE